MNMISDAVLFACAAHKAVGHKRKYSGKCYTVHLKEVAGLVEQHGGSSAMIAAAWLHDVLEDTEMTLADLQRFFPPSITSLVDWLTDVSRPEDGNRATRKNMDVDRLERAPADAQTIKYCDLISNTRSIVRDDPKFAELYLAEKRHLLSVMTDGNKQLLNMARSSCV